MTIHPDVLDCRCSLRRQYKKRMPAALGVGQTFEKPLSAEAFLDADLLSRFQWLPLVQQEALAAAVGVERQQLLSHMGEMLLAVVSI